MSDNPVTGFIMLKNVRCNFPHLFEPPVINGDPGKCGSQLLLDNESDAKQIKKINKIMQAILDEIRLEAPATG